MKKSLENTSLNITQYMLFNTIMRNCPPFFISIVKNTFIMYQHVPLPNFHSLFLVLSPGDTKDMFTPSSICHSFMCLPEPQMWVRKNIKDHSITNLKNIPIYPTKVFFFPGWKSQIFQLFCKYLFQTLLHSDHPPPNILLASSSKCGK